MATIGQMLMVTVKGTKVTREVELFMQETGAGGVILFGYNYESPRQLASFIRDLRGCADSELIVAVDQEGGRVARFGPPFTELPPMARLAGREGGEEMAESVGRLLGEELGAVGVDLDFAPVLDVSTNAFNPVIGDRAMSADCHEVARLSTAFIRGMQGAGVAACGKHFPGHGDSDVDSHLGLPVLSHSEKRFEALELVPFRAATEAGVESLMTSHLMIPSLDREVPITISRAVTTGLLRKRLGFQGLVFTDDLTMRGITDRYPPYEASWRAISAGADMVIVCHDADAQRSALEGIRKAVGEGTIPTQQLSDSLRRIAGIRARRVGCGGCEPSLRTIGNREHRRIAKALS